MTVKSSPSTELVAQRIERLFASLTPELQTAARWLLSHQQEAAVLSMRRCAVMAGVSAPTMTRLAKALELTGFADIQRQLSTATLALAKQQLAAVRQALPVDSYAANARLVQANARNQSGRNTNSAWLHTLSQAQVANAVSGSTSLTPVQWQALGKRLLLASHVVCLGLRASFSVAQQLHYAAALLRPNVHLMHANGGSVDVLCGLGSRDAMVVVSQAPYTQQTLDTATQAKRQGLFVVAVTDSTISPFAGVADQVVVFEAQTSSFFPSMLGSLSAVETLVAAMALQAKPKDLEHLAAREHYLRDQRAYVLTGKDSATFLQLSPHVQGILKTP